MAVAHQPFYVLLKALPSFLNNRLNWNDISNLVLAIVNYKRVLSVVPREACSITEAPVNDPDKIISIKKLRHWQCKCFTHRIIAFKHHK